MKTDEINPAFAKRLAKEITLDPTPKSVAEILGKIFIAFLQFIGLITVSILAAVTEGFVLIKLWGWFVLPVFNMMPTFELWQAAGIMIVASLLTNSDPQYKDHKLDTASNLVMPFIKPWVYLLVGWIIQLFI